LCEEHQTCGGTRKPFGSKFTIASAGITGQYGSRVILDFAHTGRDEHSRYRTETAAILDISNEPIRQLVPCARARANARSWTPCHAAIDRLAPPCWQRQGCVHQ